MSNSEIPNNPEIKDKQNLPIHIEWQIPSVLEEVSKYRDSFEDTLSEINNSWIDEDTVFRTTLGFDEALTNAVKYGNREDPQKYVGVVVDVTDTKLTVSIIDTNPTEFNPDTAFNSVVKKANRHSDHGRGLTIMKAYYDKVTFQFMNPGNKVTLTKNKS